MKKKTILLIVCAVVVLGAAAFFGWRFLGGSHDDGTGVYVQPVNELNMYAAPSATVFAGVVESQESVHVDPQSGKKVASLLVKEGDIVTEGQALFRYDTDAIKLDIQQAELDMELNEQNIKSLQEEIEELERYANNTTPEGQMNAARIQQLEVEIATKEYQQKQKKNELTRLQASLKDDTAKASIAGTVQAINEAVAEGNGGYDMQGNPQHYITLTASGDFRVKGSVSEQFIMDLYEGQAIVIRSRVNDDMWSGTISRIDTSQPEQNEDNYYYDDGNGASKYAFYVEPENTEGLMMGQHVTLSPDYGSGEMAAGLWLSSGWFTIAEDGSATVWKQGASNRLTKQAVVLGEYNESYDCYMVMEGLTEEDYIAWPDEECREGSKTTTVFSFDEGGDMMGEDFSEDFSEEYYPEDDMVMDDMMVEDSVAMMPELYSVEG
ncbi:MAG: efflux RND transporter periplasmic adaptor subunit [Oscillospiraceae bacterium]|nr:efflux RND transporter periplasmic adaptor subunit [Oscillospiraceae bacterium]